MNIKAEQIDDVKGYLSQITANFVEMFDSYYD